MTTRICGSVIRSLAAFEPLHQVAAVVAASAILLVWSISSTITLTLRGSLRLRHGSLLAAGLQP